MSYVPIAIIRPSTPQPSAPHSSEESDELSDLPPNYYDLDFSLASSNLSKRLNEERFEKTFIAKKCFKQHFVCVLFILAMCAAIVFGILYITKSSNDEGQFGSFGSKCELFPPNQDASQTNSTEVSELLDMDTQTVKNVLITRRDKPDPLQCNSTANLMCDQDNLTCKCERGMYFNPLRSSCQSFAGTECSNFNHYKPCTPHAYCSQGNSTVPGTCVCQPDYSQVPSGICLLDHGKYGCTTSADCNIFKFLKCHKEIGQCDCDDRNSQYWDDVREICATKVGGPCNQKEQCVSNSTCIDQRCRCSENYRVTPNRQCALDFNQECVHSNDCHSSFICKSINQKKYCRCRSEEEYRDGKCIAKAGKKCIPDVNECDNHSTCDLNSGLCSCNPGYSQTKTSLCLAERGIFCALDSDCNYELYLVCSTETEMCDCRVDYHVAENGLCVTNVHAGAGLNSPVVLITVLLLLFCKWL